MDNFFGLGGLGEIALILFIALLFLGPEKMIGFARSLGKWVYNIRQATMNITAEIDREVKEQHNIFGEATDPLKYILEAEKIHVIRSGNEFGKSFTLPVTNISETVNNFTLIAHYPRQDVSGAYYNIVDNLNRFSLSFTATTSG